MSRSKPPAPAAPGLLARMLHLAARLRPLARVSKRLHVGVFRLSRGTVMRRWFGAPVLVIETVGRRSRRPRRVPVTYCASGDVWVVVAINAGSSRTPGWWLNLEANPEAAILLRGHRIPVRAREAQHGERDRLWQVYAEQTPVIDQFRAFTDRPIPVVVLEPLDAPPSAD